MLELASWLLHWRYVALATVIVLGNVGLPVPEETVLMVAGYLVRENRLALGLTLAVGIASAVAGDNLGYWLGRLGGRPLVVRGARRLDVSPARLERLQGLVARYGALAVITARFVPGCRMLAGPLAGASSMPPLVFMPANLLGAVLFVPYALAMGYAVGAGLDAVGAPPHAWTEGSRWWVPAGMAALALTVAGTLALARRRRRLNGSAGTH